MRFEDFEAAIHVNDDALEEYGVLFDEDERQATCWIASEEAKPFSIVYKPLRPRPFAVSGRMHVDGRYIGGVFIDAKRNVTIRTTCALSGDVARPFLFTALQVTDDQRRASTPSQALGQIRLDLWHIERSFKTEPAPVRDLSIDPAHENSKKQMVHHHQVNFGEERPHNFNFYNTTTIKRLVTFIFNYRSLDVLMDNGIVPRPQTTISYREEKRRAADLDRMEAEYYDAQQSPSTSAHAKSFRGMIRSMFTSKTASSRHDTQRSDRMTEKPPEYRP